MTNTTFKQVYDLAFSDADLPSFLSEDLIPLHGCGLAGFQSVTVTMKVAAAMLRGQCTYLNGAIDSVELNEMAKIFRHKVQVV